MTNFQKNGIDLNNLIFQAIANSGTPPNITIGTINSGNITSGSINTQNNNINVGTGTVTASSFIGNCTGSSSSCTGNAATSTTSSTSNGCYGTIHRSAFTNGSGGSVTVSQAFSDGVWLLLGYRDGAPRGGYTYPTQSGGNVHICYFICFTF